MKALLEQVIKFLETLINKPLSTGLPPAIREEAQVFLAKIKRDKDLSDPELQAKLKSASDAKAKAKIEADADANAKADAAAKAKTDAEAKAKAAAEEQAKLAADEAAKAAQAQEPPKA